MAVPAPLAQIHLAAELLQRRIIRGIGLDPFELAEISPDHGGHVGGPRRWLDKRQDALGGDGEEEEEDPGHQSDKARTHSAGPPAGIGAGPRAGMGALSSAGRASAVIIRLNTSKDIPMSMVMPLRVRTSQ